MKLRLKDYLIELRKLDEKNKKLSKEDLDLLLTNIKFFQHERLIHLLVTIFVGLGTIMFFDIAITNELISFLILGLITLILFICYIFYYYFLENSVQELYDHYNSLKKNS